MTDEKNISSQLNELFNPKPPEEFDPENDFGDDKIRFKKNNENNEEISFNKKSILPEIPLNPKFAAKKISRSELDKSQENLDSDIESENNQNIAELRSSDEKLSENEDKSDNSEKSIEKNDGDLENIDEALNTIRHEDEIQQKNNENAAKITELERAQQVVQQRKVTDSLIGLRILTEKILNVANKLPQSTSIEKFKENGEIKEKYQNNISQIKEFILKTISIQSKLLKQAGILDNLPVPKTLENSEQIWEILNKTQNSFKDKTYDIIENWMEKTQIHINAKLKQTVKSLGLHPLRQAEDKYTKNKQKMISKAQTKSKAFRVLGNAVQTIHDMKDSEIYDDSEFYQTFLRDYLALNAKVGGNSKEEEELNWTYKYLQSKGIAKKEKIGAPLIESKKRKNKTIKYVVHERLVNFMAQQENPNLIPGYGNIVKSLFGIQREEAEAAPIKRKRIGTEELVEEMEKIGTKQDEVDIALI